MKSLFFLLKVITCFFFLNNNINFKAQAQAITYFLKVPDAFSPNNDGYNDVWFVKTNNITNFNLNIFNRWGKLIFNTTDILNGWNGTDQNGNDAELDAYIYQITATDPNNNLIEKKGTILLLK